MTGLIIILTLLAACAPATPSPEQQVRALLAATETAAEARDAATLKDLISEDYLDERGNSRDDIVRLIQFYLLRNQSIYLLTRIRSLALPTPTRAEVSVAVAMAGTPLPEDASLLDFSADFNVFELTLVQEDDAVWRVVNTRWQHAAAQDFL